MALLTPSCSSPSSSSWCPKCTVFFSSNCATLRLRPLAPPGGHDRGPSPLAGGKASSASGGAGRECRAGAEPGGDSAGVLPPGGAGALPALRGRPRAGGQPAAVPVSTPGQSGERPDDCGPAHRRWGESQFPSYFFFSLWFNSVFTPGKTGGNVAKYKSKQSWSSRELHSLCSSRFVSYSHELNSEAFWLNVHFMTRCLTFCLIFWLKS